MFIYISCFNLLSLSVVGQTALWGLVTVLGSSRTRHWFNKQTNLLSLWFQQSKTYSVPKWKIISFITRPLRGALLTSSTTFTVRIAGWTTPKPWPPRGLLIRTCKYQSKIKRAQCKMQRLPEICKLINVCTINVY